MEEPVVVLVEDESALRASLRKGLRLAGFEAYAAASGSEFLDLITRHRPDVMVLDIGLPDADGRDVAMAARARGVAAPVLFLTARDSKADRLAGFNSGADDYVAKPFDFDELVARLRALTRRNNHRPATTGTHLDPATLSITDGDHLVALTPTEFRLLAALASADGVLTRQDLIRRAWPPGAYVSENTLDSYIARVRRKIRGFPQFQIRTVHRVGYRLA